MLRARILSSRAEKESLGGGLSRAFFAAMRLGEDLGGTLHVRGGLQREPAGPTEFQIVAGLGRDNIWRHCQREADVVEIAEGSAVTEIDYDDIETTTICVELGEGWHHQVINIKIEGGYVIGSRPRDDPGVVPTDGAQGAQIVPSTIVARRAHVSALVFCTVVPGSLVVGFPERKPLRNATTIKANGT